MALLSPGGLRQPNTPSMSPRLQPKSPMSPGAPMASYKKGGIVKKTGPALVHKGEKVIPAHKVKKTSKKK